MAQEHDENPQKDQRREFLDRRRRSNGIRNGQGDPNKLLKLMGSKRGKDAEMAFVRTGTHHPQHHHHHDHKFYNNFQNSYFGQSTPYWPGYYSPASAMQPYHHQYPFAGGYNNYGY